MDLEFFRRIRWTQITLHFAVEKPVKLPPFAGSTIRGALGWALRDVLCGERTACAIECLHPRTCVYHELFERTRDENGSGRNTPKPYLIDAPVPAELERIIAGGPVTAPYRQSPSGRNGAAPLLANDHNMLLPSGAGLPVVLTLFGPLVGAACTIVSGLARRAVDCGGGRLRLIAAVDSWRAGRSLYSESSPSLPVAAPQTRTFGSLLDAAPPRVRALRLMVHSPARIRGGDDVCYDPRRFGEAFFQHVLVRAIALHDAFCSPGGERLPRMDAPSGLAHLVGWRAFRYVLPRYSNRQRARMRFDGLVGMWDFIGDLAPLAPLARIAEALHVGQKATFGMGAVQCLFDEPPPRRN